MLALWGAELAPRGEGRRGEASFAVESGSKLPHSKTFRVLSRVSRANIISHSIKSLRVVVEEFALVGFGPTGDNLLERFDPLTQAGCHGAYRPVAGENDAVFAENIGAVIDDGCETCPERSRRVSRATAGELEASGARPA